jgi:fatty-acyl-CoA synthase
VVLGPGTIPKTPSGKLRRAHSLSLVSLSAYRAPRPGS